MEEKRRSVRTEMQAELVLTRLDQKTDEKVDIRILDLSSDGIGFFSDRELAIGNVYECNLTIWTKDTIHSFVEVVRQEKENESFHCGGIFVGMTEMDAFRISAYQTVEKYGQ
jgi:hypothetical protein